MDPTYAIREQAPFAYYPVDSAAQYRQPGNYTSHPSDLQPFYGPIQAFAAQHQPCMPEAQPVYARPPMMNMHRVPSSGPYHPGMNRLTPMASPQPSNVKPSIVVQDPQSMIPMEARFVSHEIYGFSSPPPLSTPGSTISSPPSTSDAIRTPVNEGIFSFEVPKEGCENEVNNELLVKSDWSQSETPPMTPGE